MAGEGEPRRLHLSPWFDGLLEHFEDEARRCGGEARRVGAPDRVAAIYLYHPVEQEASIFTLDRGRAVEALDRHPSAALYSDFRLTPNDEPFAILQRSLEEFPAPSYRHPVRIAEARDREQVVSLLRDLYGRIDAKWIASAPPRREHIFVVDGTGELAGVAFSTSVGSLGRVHSLSVRPSYRRAGIGRDLLLARCDWLRRLGARSVLAEVAESNEGSLAILRGAGFRTAGRIYRTPPREVANAARSGAPRNSGTPSRSSP